MIQDLLDSCMSGALNSPPSNSTSKHRGKSVRKSMRQPRRSQSAHVQSASRLLTSEAVQFTSESTVAFDAAMHISGRHVLGRLLGVASDNSPHPLHLNLRGY